MDFVLVDRSVPDVAVVTLNRPERMNSMAFEVMIPLRDTLRALSDDNSVRAVVLTGAGSGFCSGADQSGDVPDVPHIGGLTTPTIALRMMELLDDLVTTLRGMHQPVIAAVNGAAIGGGLCLALACDIRVAATGAYFRAAGINNGLSASELGLSYLLPRAIGSSRAFEIMLTGRDVDAAEAVRYGQTIAGWSRPGIELTKKTLWAGLDASSLTSHMHAEGVGQLFIRLLTGNFQEAVKARKQKRPPVFQD